MIDSLQGEVIAKSPSVLVLRVGGIGFRIYIPLSTFEALPPEGQDATILTHLYVREDELSLYGFARPGERQLFRLLLSISRVGPSVALRILSSCSPAEFKRFVIDEDVDSLKTLVKGIGKKTAMRLIVELHDSIEDLGVEAARAARSQVVRNAVEALVSLGESRSAAERAVLDAVERLGPDADEERVVHAAIRRQ
ncbi:MAG: Holliday junction branch migration protein RuvA [Planctomycetes bacterium]|nr:Holliday junction branch migration protein RuvA [Planctomycetota bacterium]